MSESVYISVITACYNGEAFLEDAIRSVLSQPTDKIEMIVVDDGSTDGTPEICKKYANQIHYFRTENRGAGHARNFALKHARGTWIAYLDSDDLFLAKSINNQLLAKLHEYETEKIDIIYTPWISSDMNLQRQVFIDPSEDCTEIKYIPKHEFWTCFYNREYLLRNQIQFYEYKEQDIASAFRFLVFVNTPSAITDNSLKFYLQRDNPQSNTHTWNYQKMHKVKAQVYNDLFINYSTDATRSWLFDTVIEQIHQYYKCVVSFGCNSNSDIKAMNGLLKWSLATGINLCSSKAAHRQFITNVFWALGANIVSKFRKGKNKIENVRPTIVPLGNNILSTRLEKLSEFILLKCIH